MCECVSAVIDAVWLQLILFICQTAGERVNQRSPSLFLSLFLFYISPSLPLSQLLFFLNFFLRSHLERDSLSLSSLLFPVSFSLTVVGFMHEQLVQYIQEFNTFWLQQKVNIVRCVLL